MTMDINAIKQQVLEAALKDGDAFVVVDQQVLGVELPKTVQDAIVTLHLGYDLKNPIPDLRVDRMGISATLSFEKKAHKCKIPWQAVVVIHEDDPENSIVFPGAHVECVRNQPTTDPKLLN